MNRKVLFNDGWEFAKKGEPFQKVSLPHDWLIYQTEDLYESALGIYRRSFSVDDVNASYLLYFEGVYMDCKIIVNGQEVGEWKYGYSSFEVDISRALLIGDNNIQVLVNHQSPNSRWYSGAGIYRNVWLKIRGRSYIHSDSLYFHARKKEKEEEWFVEIETQLQADQPGRLKHSLYDQGKLAYCMEGNCEVGDGVNVQSLKVSAPKLWNHIHPNRYELHTQLEIEGEIVEELRQYVGFRDIVLDPENGFLIQGQKVRLNGVCEHHDLGCLGAAVNRSAIARRLILLKKMGVNAIRTAHNMPAVELMELADEMGFYIVSEAFDMWERPKTTYDYARFFKEWMKKDVASWVRRDRNHPSLILWSIGNEIYDTHADERGQEVTKMLRDEVLQHDPKKNAFVTIGSNYMPWEGAQNCADLVKIAGYNYAEKYYQKHHKEHPDWVIYGSETCSTVQSRGIYHFPYEQALLADDDEQCSSLGNSTTSWGAKSTEACILADRDTPFSMGQFIWTGFDYIGEPTPYHTKNSYFGQLDTAGFPKDSYYVYQSAWTSATEAPMVHIFPYWDFNPGQTVDVRVCSNAAKVELYQDQVLVGAMDIDHQKGSQLVAHFQLPYQPGELKALAYDVSGKIVAQDRRVSFKEAKKMILTCEQDAVRGDGEDLAFITIQTVDEKGNPVENANNRVQVKVSEQACLRGLDNGDSTDYDAYKGTSRRLFSGKLLAVVSTRGVQENGEIAIEVSSEGLENGYLQIPIVPNTVNREKGSSCYENLREYIQKGKKEEIPLRKIELSSQKGRNFSPSEIEKTVQFRLLPENTSYHDIEWSLVNAAGIPTKIAEYEIRDHEILLKAKGDGVFYLRAMSKNGTDKICLISQLDFEIREMGAAYKNPYEFLSAGLYDIAKGDVSNGNERGVATSRDGETWVGFRDLDFGPVGADTLSIPIFALSNEAYEIEIWEGIPKEEGSEILAEVVYQKESIWNVYQEATYRLNRRLKGVRTICFVLRKKIHIKGFLFHRIEKAFERIMANECDKIYGDHYRIVENRVEEIGNNVSLVFENMDFAEEGIRRIRICGHSPIDRNTIHLRFQSEEGELSQIVEFTYSEGYEEREFVLEKVTGKQKVSFVFLPGCQFHMESFLFLP
ncbi:MAG: DUF4982 domain-containing protein [Vallitaleaceae bacterium]|nr:DUF4982 domain-containing protein [Vallitaleaceae bacterium]